MDAAQSIRDAIASVIALREASNANPALREAVAAVKRFQARRFAHTYADILGPGPYQRAARFFLDELYSDKDFSHRDAQFSRIAGALQKFFPKQVVATAVSLAQLHALTESLDHAMGLQWLVVVAEAGLGLGRLTAAPVAAQAQAYVAAWREVARFEDRLLQLSTVLAVGRELDKLTRTPGLIMMLKMMRRPAHAAGLASLQAFLESGFDTFSQMAGRGEGARLFLAIVSTRESALIGQLNATHDFDLPAAFGLA